MKIKGKDFSTLSKPRTIAIPTENGEPLTLLYAPVLNFSEFEDKYPEPQPPVITKPDGTQETKYDHEAYNKAHSEWAKQQTEWMIWKSLQANDGIEWEGVDESKPETFLNVRKELARDFGNGFVSVLLNKIIDASNLRSDMIDIATKDFLATGAVGVNN